jgi:hypothetical protein
MMFSALIKVSSGAPATGSAVQAILRTDSSNSATPTLSVEFVDSTGAAVELLSGVTVLFQAKLKNSVA